MYNSYYASAREITPPDSLFKSFPLQGKFNLFCVCFGLIFCVQSNRKIVHEKMTLAPTIGAYQIIFFNN